MTKPNSVLPSLPGEPGDRALAQGLLGSQLEFRFTPDERRQQLVVVGLDLVLQPEDLAAFSDITLYGQSVRIPPQTLKAGQDGTRLRIVARTIAFHPGAAIDLSGRHGKPPLQPTAATGANDGGEGGEGAAGEDGMPGGTVELTAERVLGTPVISANGGTGGRGQRGGRGGPGKGGAPGRDDKTEAVGRGTMGARSSHVVEQGTAGGKGGKGGKGGRAGPRGNHGNGGTIHLYSVHPCPDARLDARPGQGLWNPVADPDVALGEGGPGGVGGQGGIDHGDVWSFKTKRYATGGGGDQGDQGDAPRHPPKAGDAGDAQWQAITMGQLCAEFAREAPNAAVEGSVDGTLLAMLLMAIERHYLEARSTAELAVVREALDYLCRLTASPRPDDVAPRVAAWHLRASALAGNLARGLDLYGQAVDFVPSLDVRESQHFFVEQARIAHAVEADRNRVLDHAVALRDRGEALQGEIDRTQEQISAATRQRDQLLHNVDEFETLIGSLTTLAMQKREAAVAALDSFKDAIRDKQALDKAVGTLKIAWSVVSVCVDGAPLLTEGLPLLKDLLAAPRPQPASPPEPGAVDEAKPPAADDRKTHVVAAFGKVKGGVEGILADYHGHFDAKSWDDDSIKLIGEGLDKAAFEKQIDKYLDMPGAEGVKALVGEYLDLTEKRNKLIVERDAALQQARTLDGQVGIAEADASRLARWKQRDLAPNMPALLQYMAGSVQQAKSRLVESLNGLTRSVGYCTLRKVPLVLQDDTVSLLEAQYANILATLHEANERLGMPTRVVRSLFLDQPYQLELLKAGKPVWISLPVNTNHPPVGPFANLAQPYVFDVEVHCEGIASKSGSHDAYSTATVTHTGSSFVCDESQKPPRVLSFTHRRRTVQFQAYLSSGRKVLPESGDFTDKGRYIPLSPFTVWGVQFRAVENSDLDLSRVTRLELRLGVRGVGRDVG